MNILKLLDSQINGYYQSKGDYPSKISMSKETKDKIFKELELEPTMDLSWNDKKNNYRGIEIKIKEEIFIELGG